MLKSKNDKLQNELLELKERHKTLIEKATSDSITADAKLKQISEDKEKEI